eukprot:4180803-Amphidinium_carterae.1
MVTPEQPAGHLHLALEVCCMSGVYDGVVDVSACCMCRPIQKGLVVLLEQSRARPRWLSLRIAAASPQWRRTESFVRLSFSKVEDPDDHMPISSLLRGVRPRLPATPMSRKHQDGAVGMSIPGGSASGLLAPILGG